MARDRPRLRVPVARAVGVAVPVIFGAVFVVWPLAAVIDRSLRGVELARVVEVATRSSTRSVLWFTLAQAVVSVVATLAVGLPVAHALARYRFPGRQLVRAVVVVPFVLPTVVVASAFAALFDRIGLSARSTVAIVAAHVFFNIAVVVRVVGGFWAAADRRPEEAAAALGAGRWTTFRLVTLPRLGPVLAASSVLVFLFSFTSCSIDSTAATSNSIRRTA